MQLFDLLSWGGGETAVGLSIGTSSIKLVELKRQRKTWKLLHFGIYQLPEDAVVNREIVNNIAIVESLRTLTQQVKLKSKALCTALSGTSVIIKRLSIQVTDMKELQEQVFWEAEQYLPFDVSEVVMDYQLLSKPKEQNADVLLVAVKKSVLDSYMGCIEDASLKPKVVDVDHFAMQNLFEMNYSISPQEATALVDIGASSIKLNVVHQGIPVFTKDSAMGGKNITAEIQKNLNLSFVDAETLKVGGSASGMAQEVSELLHIAVENFADDIKRSIDFYHASASGAPITSILLTGGSAKLPNLSKTIEESTGLPTQIINPFIGISYDPKYFTQDYIASIAPYAAIPIGLALRMGRA